MSTATATKRILNFSAGPAILPEPVLEQAREDLWSARGSGIGICEHSHRGPVFDAVIEEAEASCRAIGNISDDFAVLFLQGGATTQFATIPMSFLPAGASADYANTGVWTKKAIAEAKRFGKVNVAFDGSTTNFDHVPSTDELKLDPNAAYFHYCSNNTIYGTRFDTPPAVKTPLIADTSSEMYSRPFDFASHAMIYAGAQKNLGPSGVALVIIHRDFMETANSDVPLMFNYAKHAAKGSRLNTPPTFGIYMMGLVFKWILDEGGLAAMAERNERKAKHVYDAIDSSGGFYSAVARADCRSLMNIPFRTPSADTDAAFLKAAGDAEMSGLKGHRDVGGLRASIYNAFPEEGCERLASFMAEFARTHG